MYLPIESQQTCALAWLAATQNVNAENGHEARNVIVNVSDPATETTRDKAIISEVDAFLRAADKWPVQTVANTIFPQIIYERHGRPKFYTVYLEQILPRLKTGGDWGRYFERMISFPTGKKGNTINPLDDIISKMKGNVSGDRCFMHVYELTIYDPIRDAERNMNRQCMSFLSFHLSEEEPRRLHLTAVYRNHYYTERLLGNLIGLGRLMKYVSLESGIEVGELTIISSHAVVDNPGKKRSELNEIIAKCASLASNPDNLAA